MRIAYKLPPIIFYDKLKSTQDKAWEFYEKGLNRIVVMAIEQSMGHGRHGRAWFSPKGGLWFSYLKTIKIQPELLDLVSMTCAVAVTLVLRDLKLNAFIRWPNDIMVNNKKIAGILVSTKFSEREIIAIVIGIGLNLNFNINEFPEELKKQATTVLNETKHYVDEFKILSLILQKLDTFLDNIIANRMIIYNYAKQLNYLKNKHVKILLTSNKIIEDTVEDIDEFGKLITSKGLVLSIYDALELY